MPGIDRSRSYLFVAQGRISKEFRESFVEPQRQVTKIQPQEGVRIFMVEGVKWVLALRIQPHDHIVFVLTRLIQARMMNVAFCLPFLGKEQFQCVLVFCGHNDDRLPGVHAH